MEAVTITVTRKRTRQPVQYESESAEIQVVVNLDPDSDWEQTARELLETTTALVYNNLGLKLPASTSSKKVENPTDTAKVDVKTDDDKPKVEGKKRGRPRKENPDLPGTVPESANDNDNDADEAPASDEKEVEAEVSDVPKDQGELQTALVGFIKTAIKRNGTDMATEAAVAKKIMFDLAGVIKSSDVTDEDIAKVYEAVKEGMA